MIKSVSYFSYLSLFLTLIGYFYQENKKGNRKNNVCKKSLQKHTAVHHLLPQAGYLITSEKKTNVGFRVHRRMHQLYLSFEKKLKKNGGRCVGMRGYHFFLISGYLDTMDTWISWIWEWQVAVFWGHIYPCIRISNYPDTTSLGYDYFLYVILACNFVFLGHS